MKRLERLLEDGGVGQRGWRDCWRMVEQGGEVGETVGGWWRKVERM